MPATRENEPLSPGELGALGRVVPEPESGMGRNRLVELLRRRDVRDANPEVVDRATLPQRPVVHGLGAVAVRVEQEGAVVVLPVLRTRAGRAVFAVSGLGPHAPELVDVGTRGCHEGRRAGAA